MCPTSEIPIATRIIPNVGRAAVLKAADCSSERVIVPVADIIEDTEKCCTIRMAAIIARPLTTVVMLAFSCC